ncbi:MAG: LPS export ABC transporter periplasmic protein LptC [Treponema sp.]|nr:LPS export ABC transporter periplasmic protein LptC [Candidatus Treponema equi]
MKRLFPILILISMFSFSCSLKYEEPINSEDTSPELQFTNVDYKKYKEKKLDTRIQAEVLERYKADGAAYARNASFFSWDENGELATEGSCALLGIDSENEIYTMFNSIFLHNIEQNFTLKATNLKWNGKTEQLSSGINDTVYLNRDDIEIEGTGFSASGITRSFEFSGSVSGTVTTEDDEEATTDDEN